MSVPQESIARVLMGLRRRELTGRLEVRDVGGDCSTVYLRKGRVVDVERPDALDRLAQVLQQAVGMVPMAALVEAARSSADDQGLVRALLAKGIAAETLREALRLQLRRKLSRLFFTEPAQLQATAGEHSFGGSTSVTVEVDPRAIVLPGIRAAYDDARLARELGPLSGRTVRLAPVDPALARELGLPGPEDPTMALLASRGMLIDGALLLTRGDRAATSAKVLLLALYHLGLIGADNRGVTAPPVSPADQDAPPAPARKRTGITGLQLLDLETIARTAEGFFRNGDMARAENAFRLAVNSDPKNARFRSFLAWINYRKPDTDRIAFAPEAIVTLRQAIAADPRFAQGQYFLGELLKQKGELPGAERAFRAAIEADPTLNDAARELRLIQMRKGKGGGRAA